MDTAESKITLNSIERTIEGITGLISLPEIYLKFRHLMSDPNSSIEEFGEVVSCDPNLALTVLKVVNSAFFGFPGQVASIERAIVMLGIGQLHDMVLANSAMSSLDLPNEIVPLKTFWRYSLYTGILARLLAGQLNVRKSDGLFIIGVLHEIGHLVIYSRYPDQAKLAIQDCHEGKLSLHIAEQGLLGLHYGQVGSRLMRQWQLPVNFQKITHNQPTPMNADEHQLETALLHVAHGYAHKFFSETELTHQQLIDPEALKLINLLPGQLENASEMALQIHADLETRMLK